MKLELKLAFKNLFGARLRTLLNVLVLSFSFVIIIFLNSIMDGWDQQAQKDSIEWEFGNGHLINKKFDPLDPYTILDGHGRIPKGTIGTTPVLDRQATIYPQGRSSTDTGVDGSGGLNSKISNLYFVQINQPLNGSKWTFENHLTIK